MQTSNISPTYFNQYALTKQELLPCSEKVLYIFISELLFEIPMRLREFILRPHPRIIIEYLSVIYF